MFWPVECEGKQRQKTRLLNGGVLHARDWLLLDGCAVTLSVQKKVWCHKEGILPRLQMVDGSFARLHPKEAKGEICLNAKKY